jgi:hypothetical protein
MLIRCTPSMFLFLVLLVVGGCADDSTTPDPDASVRGLVVDSRGNPVPGAAILLSYDVSQTAETNNKTMMVISFSLPKESHVRLWVSEPCRERTVRLLVDSDLVAGPHGLQWEGRDDEGLRQISGLYVLNLETNDTTITREIFLDVKTYAQYLTAEGMDRFAETGADGRFRFDQDCLALGRNVQGAGEDGTQLTDFTISRRVNIWAIHEDFGAACSTGLVTIDQKNGASVVIAFGELSQARSYAADHWSEQRLACAYDFDCAAGPPLAGTGRDYFSVSNYRNLPLWVSQADDEEDFLENIGRWMQFVFGWDDFVHPSEFMGDAYVPGDMAALDDKRISANRETYRALLKMAGSRAVQENAFRSPLGD